MKKKFTFWLLQFPKQLISEMAVTNRDFPSREEINPKKREINPTKTKICWGYREREGRSSPTNSWLESVGDVNGDTAIAAPKINAIKPPALHVSRRMPLKPMRYDICAIFGSGGAVGRAMVGGSQRCGSCHGRRKSAVADQF